MTSAEMLHENPAGTAIAIGKWVDGFDTFVKPCRDLGDGVGVVFDPKPHIAFELSQIGPNLTRM